MTDLWQTTPAVGWSARGRLGAVSRAQIVRYGAATGNVNLVHVDEVYATQTAGHAGLLTPGMLTMGLTASFLTGVAGRDHLRRFGGRFVGAVLAGDGLECGVSVSEVILTEGVLTVSLDVTTKKDDGRVVFVGSAEYVRPD